MSNLFCVQQGESGPMLKSLLLTHCGVKGIIRENIINVADAAGFFVQETTLKLADLYRLQELFLCNTLTGIWPVTGQPGQASESLHD